MINQQLLGFIKEQLQKGITKEIITKELLVNGWNNEDVEEGFKVINIPSPVLNSIPVPNPIINQTPISNFNSFNPGVGMSNISVQPKKHSGRKIFLIVLILFLLAGGASAYYFKNDLKNLPVIKNLFPNKNAVVNKAPVVDTTIQDSSNQNQNSLIKSAGTEPTQQVQNQVPNVTQEKIPTVKNQSNNTILPEQKDTVKLISLKDGQKVISGSTINVKYEITSDNVNGVVMVGDCTQIISGKLKGIYSFDCKIQTKLGLIKASAADFKKAEELDELKNNTLNLEVIAPVNAKPIEIIYYPSNGFLSAMTGNDSTYISVSIKYSDKITRDIPFGYLKYSLDDPSLVSFLYPEKIMSAYFQSYIANRGGETTLHLEYQGVKKDIPVHACSTTSPEYSC